MRYKRGFEGISASLIKSWWLSISQESWKGSVTCLKYLLIYTLPMEAIAISLNMRIWGYKSTGDTLASTSKCYNYFVNM